MKKQRETWSDPKLRDARNKSLLAGNPEKKFGVRAGLDETLPLTLHDIQEFIWHAYDHDLSPLDHLRQYYPDFEWKYHGEGSCSPENVERFVSEADYAFLRRPSADSSIGIVTARRKAGGRARKYCFVWYDANGESYNYMAWPKELSLRFIKL